MAQRENGIKNYLIVRIRLRTSCLLVGVIVNRCRSMTPKKEGIRGVAGSIVSRWQPVRLLDYEARHAITDAVQVPQPKDPELC